MEGVVGSQNVGVLLNVDPVQDVFILRDHTEVEIPHEVFMVGNESVVGEGPLDLIELVKKYLNLKP